MVKDLAARYNSVLTEIKKLEKEKKKLQDIFKAQIGEKKGFRSDEFWCTWTNFKVKSTTDWESVEGHFIRTLEKSGMDIKEAQSTVQKIIKLNTREGGRSGSRAFKFKWKG